MRGKTKEPGVDLMTQSPAREMNWMKVKR